MKPPAPPYTEPRTENLEGNNILDSPPKGGHDWVDARRSPTADILDVMFPHGYPYDKRLIVTLQAYFDESGTNPGHDAFVLAGYISTAERWLRFSDAWRGLVVDEWRLSHFHMADFESRHGPYKDWPNGVRRERLSKLIDLIAEHAIASVAFSIPRAPFLKVFGDLARDDVRYLIAGARAFDECSKVNRFGRTERATYLEERISYVFEAGAKGAGRVQKAFNRAYNRPDQRLHYRLMSFTTAGKECFEPLQAADILAYELYKHWLRQFGTEKRATRYPLDRLAVVPHEWASLTEKALVEYKPTIAQWLREPYS